MIFDFLQVSLATKVRMKKYLREIQTHSPTFRLDWSMAIIQAHGAFCASPVLLRSQVVQSKKALMYHLDAWSGRGTQRIRATLNQKLDLSWNRQNGWFSLGPALGFPLRFP